MQMDPTSPYSLKVKRLYYKGESMKTRRLLPGSVKFAPSILVLALVCLTLPLAAQQLIATPATGIGNHQVAVNSVSGKAYISSNYGGWINVIDRGLATTVIGLRTAGPIAIDEVRNIVYAGGAGLAIIDGATNNTIVTLHNISPWGGMAVNPITNKIYVITAYGVTVVDGTTYAELLIPAGENLENIAINTLTNKIYVTGQFGTTVTVIDGATNSTVSVPVGNSPNLLAINPYTNKIYVTVTQQVTVIDGATLATTPVPLGAAPVSMDVDNLSNKVYVSLVGSPSNSIGIIDGNTLSVSSIPIGPLYPTSLVVNPITKKIYLDYGSYPSGMAVIDIATQRISYIFTTLNYPNLIAVDTGADRIYSTDYYAQEAYVVAGPDPQRFIPVTPCRVVDTRNLDGPFGGPTIQGGSYRIFPIPQGGCNIPADAAAYSFNVTVVPQGHLGYLTLWPDGQGLPGVSTINSVDGRIKAGASISPAGAAGAVDAYASNTTDLILDINGYFERASSTALAFYPLTGCRVADTRTPAGPLGGPYLLGDQERDFPVLESACGIPSTAQAYSLNVTAYPHGRLGYLTVWPEGQPQPQSSTLNAINGLATANEAIVPAGVSGGVAVYPSADTDVTLDVNGYFAAPGEGGMSFYPLVPCRVLDTRQHHGAFTGTIVTDVVDSGCGTQDALVYVMNATVVPQTGLNHVTIWPTSEQQPPVYTLEAWDGVITSNLAIVANIDGWLNAYASNSTQLILDSFGYFAP